MPYAQVHYPFENKENFEKNFLLVCSTHLFGAAPWKNVIVTGLVLAAYVLALKYLKDRS
jgi:isoleucyl-tRNA synthetase